MLMLAISVVLLRRWVALLLGVRASAWVIRHVAR